MNSQILIQLKHWLIEVYALLAFFSCCTIMLFIWLTISCIFAKENNNKFDVILTVWTIMTIMVIIFSVFGYVHFEEEIHLVRKRNAVQCKEIIEKKIEKKMAEDEKLKQLRIQKWQKEEALIEQSKNK